MSASSDRVLLERWQNRGDAGARDALVERYQGLARAVARRYADWGEPFDDLAQVAMIGLLKAIDRFDTTRDVQLSTYAMPTMVGEIRRHYRDRTSAVRVPRGVQELRVRVNAAIDRLGAAQGAAPSVAAIAEEVGALPEDVLEALQSEYARNAAPLGPPDADVPGAVDVAMDERGFDEADARLLLQPGLARLDDRDRRILALRFEDGLSQSQIAAQVGISQMHVSRLLRRALETLRASVEEADVDG